MLASQRHAFDIPRDVVYWNAASLVGAPLRVAVLVDQDDPPGIALTLGDLLGQILLELLLGRQQVRREVHILQRQSPPLALDARLLDREGHVPIQAAPGSDEGLQSGVEIRTARLDLGAQSTVDPLRHLMIDLVADCDENEGDRLDRRLEQAVGMLLAGLQLPVLLGALACRELRAGLLPSPVVDALPAVASVQQVGSRDYRQHDEAFGTEDGGDCCSPAWC